MKTLVSDGVLGSLQQLMTLSQTAFSLSLNENILSVDLNPQNPQPNSQIVQDLIVQINELRQSKAFRAGPLLKITGKQSIPMGYVLANALSPHFGAIAIYDPANHGYIVAISHDSTYAVGEVTHD